MFPPTTTQQWPAQMSSMTNTSALLGALHAEHVALSKEARLARLAHHVRSSHVPQNADTAAPGSGVDNDMLYQREHNSAWLKRRRRHVPSTRTQQCLAQMSTMTNTSASPNASRICMALYVIAFTSVPLTWRPRSKRSPRLRSTG